MIAVPKSRHEAASVPRLRTPWAALESSRERYRTQVPIRAQRPPKEKGGSDGWRHAPQSCPNLSPGIIRVQRTLHPLRPPKLRPNPLYLGGPRRSSVSLIRVAHHPSHSSSESVIRVARRVAHPGPGLLPSGPCGSGSA